MSAKNSNKRSNSDLDTNNSKLQKLNDTKLYSIVINQKVVEQLKKEVLEIIFNCPIDNIVPNKQQNLPGTMPWAITRNQLNLLFTEEYWVAEKSDGVRKLLYISYDTKGVYLIDRAWKFDLLTNSKDYWDLFSAVDSRVARDGSPCILDGELIMDEVTKTERFAIFDVIYYNQFYYANERLIGRHKIITHLNNLYQQNKSRFPSNHLPIGSKAFREIKYIDQILDCIRPTEDGHYLYKDNKGRCNLNDGLIFTPVQDNYFYKEQKLLKWKWPEMNTIDFLIKEPFIDEKTNNIQLYVSGKHNSTELYATITDPNEQTLEWISQVQSLTDRSECVVECSPSQEGCKGRSPCPWQIVGLRLDKLVGNYITVAQATEKVIQDNITADDLRQLFTSRKPVPNP